MAGGGGTQDSTTTTEIDPTLRPYVDYGLGEAKTLYQSQTPSFYPGQTFVSPSDITQSALQAAQQRATTGSPLLQAAQAEQLATIQGRNVNPFLEGALAGTNRQAQEAYTQGVQGLQSRAAQSGRYGSQALNQQVGQAQDIFGRNLAESAGQLAYQSAEAERGRQQAAIAGAPQMAEADYGDIQRLMTTGQMGEQYQSAELQDAINRFNFEQNLPAMKLNQYGQFMSGMPAGNITTQTATPTGGK